MRAAAILVAIGVLAASAVCVRLGVWQIARWHQKQALNAAIRSAQQSPQIDVTAEPPPAAEALNRSLRMAGRYDESTQFLLSGMLHEGEPGVEVVTPLRLAGRDTAVLIDRGWLPADDATTARPQDHAEPGDRAVTGVAEPVKRGAGAPGPRRLAGDAPVLYSLRWIDVDSIAARLPYPVAGYVVRQFPAPGLPALPRRSARPLYDETMHVGYAIQWFLFALLIPGGTAALACSRRRRPAARPSTEASP